MIIVLCGTAISATSLPSARAFQATTPASPTEASPVASPPPAVVIDDQAFVSGAWRITVVVAQQADAFPDFKLTASDGKSWIVVVADVANSSTNDAKLSPKTFQVIAAGASKPTAMATGSSKRIAQLLQFDVSDPTASAVIGTSVSERFALAFQVDATAVGYSLIYNGASLPLAASITQGGAFDALPGPAALPKLTPATFSSAISGSSVKLKTGTVSLAGVDAPAGTECFSDEAVARIKKLVSGKKIYVEQSDGNAVYLWVEQSDGTRALLNVSLVSGGYAAAASGLTGSYASWIASAEAAARAAGGGLWAVCTNQHGQARTAKAETTAIVSHSDGKDRSYVAWLAYPPEIIATPDGGAWIFYSAQPTSGADHVGERLFASHYDPTTAKWSTGVPMPGGQYQMGASAVVDSTGLVHLVYSDQAQSSSYAVLMYVHEDGAGGWTKPVAVADDLDAGHQLYPSLAIDKKGVLHVAWQDQRVFSAQARPANASNADVLVSDFTPGEATWSKPFLVDTHFFDAASLFPHLVVDDNRLVLVWSVYAQSLGLTKAARIDWATRAIDKPLGWTLGQPLVAGRGDSFGGRLVDVAADPTGGVVMVFARQANDAFLFLRRLKPAATEWGSDMLITYGARGNFPTVAVAANGDVFITYEATIDKLVKVTAVAVAYRSIVPGPETVLTTAQANSQGRPGVAADLTSRPWIVYISESKDGKTNQINALRNAAAPTEVKTKK